VRKRQQSTSKQKKQQSVSDIFYKQKKAIGTAMHGKTKKQQSTSDFFPPRWKKDIGMP